ncbi:hypothetical protein [Helicobacter himalayensis]|uniref:hypothetical protein n=1 Tax=Helicobacter himalayensis TaxID=1591088 RepID=UPI000836F458|nr:hypothetical protein [Helicobacter himalayensis]
MIDSSYAQLTQKQKEEIVALKERLDSLQELLSQKEREITTLTNYTKELEERNEGLVATLKNRESALKQIEKSTEIFGVELDELLNILFSLQNQGVKAKDSESFIQSVQFNEDKELLFGLNIANDFIEQNSYQTIKYYLFNLDCKFSQTFDLLNLHPQNKSDFVLIGETFSSFVRLEAYKRNESLRGIIEILPADMLNPVQVRYYGNLDLREYFDLFVQNYSKN